LINRDIIPRPAIGVIAAKVRFGLGAAKAHLGPLPLRAYNRALVHQNDEATSTMGSDSCDNRKPSSLSAGISIDLDTLLLSEKAKILIAAPIKIQM